MKLIKAFEWIAGSMSDFTRPFQDNETLFNQAKAFWRHLDGYMTWVFVIMFVLGIGLAAFYYIPYNNKPGRHYKPTHWWCFLAITFVVTFLVTWVIEFFAVNPTLKGANILEMKIALGNAIYAVVLYFITSIVWCNIAPTNAYRLFKI